MALQSYDKIMSLLEDMRSRFDSGFSSSDRELLESLNQRFFHKNISLTGCADCYRDAYLIIYNKLRKDKIMPKQSNYCLKAGAVLHSFGSSDYYTLEVPDNVAEDFLRKDAMNINLFQRYPENWKSRINKRKERVVEAPVENAQEKAEESAEKETVVETTKASKRK